MISEGKSLKIRKIKRRGENGKEEIREFRLKGLFNNLFLGNVGYKEISKIMLFLGLGFCLFLWFRILVMGK